MSRRQDGLNLSAAEIRATFESSEWATRFPPVLSTRQAAELLQVPLDTIYDWSSRGLLRGCSHRVGKHLRFFRDRVLSTIFNEDVSDRSPPSGLPRWFTGFCATENRYQFRGSAKTGEPLGQAQWATPLSILECEKWLICFVAEVVRLLRMATQSRISRNLTISATPKSLTALPNGVVSETSMKVSHMKKTCSSTRELSVKVGERVRIFQRDTIWHPTYQLHGRQKRTSLKASNKKNAIKLALDIDRRLATGESPAPPDNCTIAAAIAAYDEYLVAERRSPKTLTKYRFVFRFIDKLADRLGRSLLSQLDLPFVDKFRAERAKSCSPKTIYTEVVIVRQLVKFGWTRRMLADDPLLGMKIRKPKPTPQPCFETEQIEQILELATDAHRPTFLLLAETGLRFGEAT